MHIAIIGSGPAAGLEERRVSWNHLLPVSGLEGELYLGS